MKAVVVKDTDLQKAAGEGMDAFIQVFTDAIHHAIGGELNAENMPDLNADPVGLYRLARRGDGWRICTTHPQRIRPVLL